LAQFRTTADIMDLALSNAGEVTNGNSPYEAELLNKLNRVHFSLVAGGTVALGKDATVEINETWPWAKAKRPLILELQPKIDSGSVTLTLGAESGSFSLAPSVSVEGWYLQVTGSEGMYRIASHSAAATAFELDAAWPLASAAGSTFTLFKLDYQLVPDFIVVDSSNNKIQFQKALSTPLTGTLTSGTYTPAQLIAHVASVITAAAGGPTITGSYSSVTRKFSLVSDLAGATLFQVIGDGDLSQFSVHKTLGFDDVTTTSAATQVSTYVLGGISRLVEPFRAQRGGGQLIRGIDSESFARNWFPGLPEEGIPTRFAIVREDEDGTVTVRMNKYPSDKARVEVEYVPIPRDLKDNSASLPIIPRKHIDILEDAATIYIMLLKSDDRAQVYGDLVKGKLLAMISQHRGAQGRTGENFMTLVPRLDLTDIGRRRKLFPEDPYS